MVENPALGRFLGFAQVDAHVVRAAPGDAHVVPILIALDRHFGLVRTAIESPMQIELETVPGSEV